MRDERVVRAEVNRPPRRVVRADLEHDEVEGAEPLPDVAELGREPRVAAEEDAMASVSMTHDDHSVPLRRPRSPGPRSGERASRGTGAGRPRALPPVELRDAFRSDAPRLEVRADAERRDEGSLALRELRGSSGGRGGRSGRARRARRRAAAGSSIATGGGWNRRGPGERHGRHALAPHRIGEDADAVDLERASVEWPSHVTRRPDDTGRAQPGRGSSTGSARVGRRSTPWPPKKYSPVVDHIWPGFIGDAIGSVFWNRPSRNRGDATTRSRRSPLGTAPKPDGRGQRLTRETPTLPGVRSS